MTQQVKALVINLDDLSGPHMLEGETGSQATVAKPF